MESMTIQQSLQASQLPSLEAQILLSYTLKKSRTWLIAHSEYEINEDKQTMYTGLVQRRMASEPISYITNVKEFYGRELYVDSRVLIPRPCTEQLIEACKAEIQNNVIKDEKITIDTQVICWIQRFTTKLPQCVVDIGTGSGCIAVTLAKEFQIPIIATDNSKDAIHVARKNADIHSVKKNIIFKEEQNYETLRELTLPFLVVSNPPYVPSLTKAQPEVHASEPHNALYSGEQGIDALQAITQLAKQNPHCVGLILECQTEQPDLLL